jgi:hypothetical protein
MLLSVVISNEFYDLDNPMQATRNHTLALNQVIFVWSLKLQKINQKFDFGKIVLDFFIKRDHEVRIRIGR